MTRQGDSLRDAAAIESTGAAKACSWVPQNDTRQGSAIANVTWSKLQACAFKRLDSAF
jgi:hypothetical protein